MPVIRPILSDGPAFEEQGGGCERRRQPRRPHEPPRHAPVDGERHRKGRQQGDRGGEGVGVEREAEHRDDYPAGGPRERRGIEAPGGGGGGRGAARCA